MHPHGHRRRVIAFAARLFCAFWGRSRVSCGFFGGGRRNCGRGAYAHVITDFPETPNFYSHREHDLRRPAPCFEIVLRHVECLPCLSR